MKQTSDFGQCSLLLSELITHTQRKETSMNKERLWRIKDDMITISQCSEGCIHLMVGRAVIKMTQEEFLALAKLTDAAIGEISFLEPVSMPMSEFGH
jgi:hypothetical protein